MALFVVGVTANAAGAQAPSYQRVEGWPPLPGGIGGWGQTIGIEIDAQDNLWVFHRCWATDCVRGRENVMPLLRYNQQGIITATWGRGLFVWPHGSTLDADGNIWLTDARGADGKGHTVQKFTPEGRLLMTLGTPGVAGATETTFDGPADVAIAPNGDIFVADGHGNDRIMKFSPTGEFLMQWGEEGSLLGEFNEPHTLAFDSQGRLFVGDRINQRIQVFDQNGRFLAVWPAIMASGIHITDDDIVLVADYQLRKGIIIANASDFSEIAVIDEALPEGVAMDSRGNIYAGEVVYNNLKRFDRR
ncbi:MAG: peptidyl-alpha-hydroxyglycine alpha-amidating lyase family protein [Longimicrobiales bacterium]